VDSGGLKSTEGRQYSQGIGGRKANQSGFYLNKYTLKFSEFIMSENQNNGIDLNNFVYSGFDNQELNLWFLLHLGDMAIFCP